MIQGYENCEELPLFQAVRYEKNAEEPSAAREKRAARKAASEERYSHKAACILSALSRGPVGCGQLEGMEFNGVRLHRAQAVVCTMRNKGHKIDTLRIDGVESYVYRGFEKRIDSKPFKSLYYTTKHWRATAKARKEIDFFACRQCGSGDDLETHHWRYNLFREYIPYDLITLCRSCHILIHEAASGSGIHFPLTITEEEARRIEANQ